MCLQIERSENSAPILWNLVIFPRSLVGKESAWKAGVPGSIPGSGRSLGEGNGNPLQYSCLENSMDRGAWQATVHGVARVGHNWATKPPTCEIQPQTHYLDLIKREHQTNPNWKSFGKMTSLELLFFFKVKVMKVRKKLRSSSRIKETQKIWQPRASQEGSFGQRGHLWDHGRKDTQESFALVSYTYIHFKLFRRAKKKKKLHI